VGDGPFRSEFEARAARAGVLDRMVFSGRVAPEDVPRWIQAMDVVVHTSLREGIARVLPQAGAVGKPVVTFALDGAPEVIRDGTSGFLVPPLDTSAVAARVVQLLRDGNARAAFGAAGRAFAAEHFGLQTMIDRITEVYLEALTAKGLIPQLVTNPASSRTASRV
jgi:glycosyltransferase involved in cell wall biosynthesis